MDNELNQHDFWGLQRAYKRLPYGTQRLAATLDAVPAAELLGPEARAAVLYDLAWGYSLGDDPAKALPTCAEFFALTEQYPNAIKDRATAPSTAMIATNVALALPQIPIEQCWALLEQFHQQVKKYGIGERLWQIHACDFYLSTRDMARVEQHMQAFYATKRDAISDCRACEASNIAECLLGLGRREEARAALQPVLDGSLTCQQQPWSALSMLICDALEHDDLEEAKALGEHLCRKTLRNCGDLSYVGALLRLWACTDLSRTVKLLEEGIRWSIGVWDQSLLFDFYRGAWAACIKLGETQENVPLRLPKKFPCRSDDGMYKGTVLAKWFYEKMEEIGKSFDQRNGNDYYIKELLPPCV